MDDGFTKAPSVFKDDVEAGFPFKALDNDGSLAATFAIDCILLVTLAAKDVFGLTLFPKEVLAL